MFTHRFIAQVSLGLGLCLVFIAPVRSQITPNGLNTQATSQGNQINITGGTQAGSNLFHSFRDFNLNSSQIANFLSNPQTQNILARINGGNPSFINGLLQVTGGNSNLFLMNPSGMVLGANTRLNVPASFTATTANQIGFGNNQYFSAVGNNNYAALIGNPDSFVFNTNQSGSIVNAGNLAVENGQNLSLIAGNTINTGRLTAPGGEIQVLAVPGTNRVRLSLSGQVLSLEIVLPESNQLRGVDLPALLTGQNLLGIVTSGETIQVAGTTFPSSQGLAAASGRIDVSNPFGTGGVVQILGDRVAILNSRINANGATGGGTVRLGGEYLGGRDTGIAPAFRFNSQRTVIDSNSFLRANATTSGNGGRIIVWADDTTGFYGTISARGGANSGNGGFAEVSGAQNLTFAGNADLSAPRGSFGTLLLDPRNIFINNGANALGGCTLPTILSSCNAGGDITISQVTLQALAAGVNVVLEASNNITIGTLTGNLLDFAVGPGGSVSFLADADSDGIGSFSMNTGDTLRAQGRNISINAASITAGDIDASISVANQSGGNVTLTATSGSINARDVSSFSGGSLQIGDSGNGGNINLLASGNIATARVEANATTGQGNSGNGGTITINSSNGSATANGINTYSATFNGSNVGSGGNIFIDLPNGNLIVNVGTPEVGSIGSDSLTNTTNTVTNSGSGGVININIGGSLFTASSIGSSSTFGNGGAININSGGRITSPSFITSSSRSGNAGSISLNAGSDISLAAVSASNITGGIGGSINIVTPALFRATAGFTNAQGTLVSVVADGANDGGSITITHGGSTTTPFTFGSPSINGTTAAITSNSSLVTNSVNSLVVPVPPVINNYGSNISIRTTASPVPVTSPTPLPSPTPIPSPTPMPTIQSVRRSIDASMFSSRQFVNPTPPITPSPVTPSPVPVASPITQSARISIDENISSRQLVNPTPPITPPPVIVGELQSSIPPIVNPQVVNPQVVNPQVVNPQVVNPQVVNPQVVNPQVVNPQVVNPQVVNPQVTSEISRPGNLDAVSPSAQTLLGNNSDQINIPIIDRLPIDFLYDRLRLLDQPFKEEFQAFTGLFDEAATLDVSQSQDKLKQIIASTGVKPALIYVFFSPENDNFGTRTVNSVRGQITRIPDDTDILEVVLVLPTGDLVRVRYPNLRRPEVLRAARQFQSEVTDFYPNSRGFLYPAQKFYNWLIAPLEDDLKKQEINNLVFLADVGLRSIPLSAMHDGNGFIIENYSLALMPSLSLTDTTYKSLKGSQVLGMGADSFTNNNLTAFIPGVSLELNIINQIWGGNTFLNDNFTLNNLRQARRPEQRIVHLATHSSFVTGSVPNSFIQLWGDERVALEEIRRFGWDNPPVDLLVLSACQTTLGDREAELGFAGLAVQSGVRSVLASLWEVSDAGTLALMTEFYQQLQTTTTKSEALRQAQLAMLRGEVRLEGGELVTPQGKFALNEELKRLGDRRLAHPYFWSAFTLVGNPW